MASCQYSKACSSSAGPRQADVPRGPSTHSTECSETQQLFRTWSYVMVTCSHSLWMTQHFCFLHPPTVSDAWTFPTHISHLEAISLWRLTREDETIHLPAQPSQSTPLTSVDRQRRGLLAGRNFSIVTSPEDNQLPPDLGYQDGLKSSLPACIQSRGCHISFVAFQSLQTPFLSWNSFSANSHPRSHQAPYQPEMSAHLVITFWT